MKKIITFTLFAFILGSCSDTEVETIETGKSDFYVDTSLGREFSGGVTFEKTWQISSSQDISLTANTSGRVSEVLVKSGDQVRSGQVIARLEDNIWNLGINVSRAANSIERAQISFESNKITLDKQVFDAELSLKNLQRDLLVLRQDGEQNLLLARDTLENSQYDNLDSSSALQLQSLENNIEKSKLDYEVRLAADEETIEWYKSTLKRDYDTLLIFLVDVIEFSDEILWVTQLNRDENDDFQDFLWVKDNVQRVQSERILEDLIIYRNSQQFNDLDRELQAGNISQQRITEIINEINRGYELAKTTLNSLETTLNNSVVSFWQLGETELSGFLSTTNTYQSQLQSNFWTFISFGTTVKSFLRTYQDNQASLWKSIELQEKERDIQLQTLQSSQVSATTWFERTRISVDDSIADLELQIESAKNTLVNAQKTRDVTLRSMQNSIAQAQIDYSSASNDFDKLTIRSPISGTISSVSIDRWQEVFSGTALFDIVGDRTPEVEISFSSRERDIVSVGSPVFIDIGPDRITGTIDSISDVADQNLNYQSTVVFQSGANIIGNIATVEIPLQTEKMLLPLNIITTKWDDIWLVKTLSGSTFADVRVRMWEVFWEYVEIVSCAKQCEDLRIITSDTSNFDANKFEIIERGENTQSSKENG